MAKAKKGKKKAKPAKKKLIGRKPVKKVKKKPAPKKKKPAPKKKKAAAKMPEPAPTPDLSDDNPLAEVKEVFDHYDRNANGFIESGELSRLLEALGAPPSELELLAAVSALDVNGSGKISWEEFKDWWLKR